MRGRIGAMMLFAVSAVLGLAADLATKAAVFSWMGPHSADPFVLIPGWLQFNTAINQGGIWSFGAAFGPAMNFWLTCFASAASVVILVWACLTIRPQQRVLPVVLGAILAGALGNLHDRFFYAGVRDFIQFHYHDIWYYPTFNLADSYLVCGAIFLVLASFFTGNHPASSAAPNRSASSALSSP